MKSKLTIYGIIALLLFTLMATSVHYRQKYLQEKADKIRLSHNQQQLLDEGNQYKRVIVTLKELNQSLTHAQDSLLQELKIKPRQVERIVEREHYAIDTTVTRFLLATNDSLKRVIEEKIHRDYDFADTSGCFVFAGSVSIDNGLQLIISNREYLNHSTEIAYLEREKKFWFIRYGPWSAKMFIDNDCGSDIVKEIKVLRKYSLRR